MDTGNWSPTRTLTLPAGSLKSAAGMTPSIFWPISMKTCSGETATTVPSRPWPPASGLCVCDCSYWDRMSAKFSPCSGMRGVSSCSSVVLLGMRLHIYCGIIRSGTASWLRLEWRRRAAQWIRPQDVVWLLLFSGMIVFNQTGEPSEIAMLVALGRRADPGVEAAVPREPARHRVLDSAEAAAELSADRLHRTA